MILGYITVFRLSDKSMFDTILFIPLIFFVFFLVFYFINIREGKTKNTWILLLLSLISFVAGMVVIPVTIKNRQKTLRIFEERRYQSVEGLVEDFEPYRLPKHKQVNFTVKGVYFEYSDANPSYSFNECGRAIYGNGEQVRIGYVTENGKNYIVKIELEE